MKNTKRIASIALSTVMLASSVVSFAADGDVFNKSDSSLFGNSSQILRDKAKRRAVLTGEDKYLYEINGALYTLVDVNKAYTVNKADFMGEIINNPDIYKPVGEASGELKVVSVSAITTTKIQVVLNQKVDDATADNFSIAGLTVTSATLNADKKTVVLVTSPAQPEETYTLSVTGLKVNAEVQADSTKEFTMPAVNTLYSGTTLEFSDEDGVLKADGADATLVTFTLRDAEKTVLKDAEDVVVSFTSTFGNFGEKRVTVQNGVATVMFTSEALTAIRNADLVGTIVEAKDSNLIGIKAANSIQLNPNPEEGEGDTTGARVTEAEAAQADRIILYFNKEVSVDKYTKVNDSAKTRIVDPEKATITVKSNVNNDLTGGTTVSPVKGLLPVEGNKKALQVLLDVDNTAPAGNAANITNKELDDNARILVEFNDLTGTVAVPSKVSFNLTDARKPEMVRVDREGLKTIKVTFSEPVTDKNDDLASITTVRANDLKNWSIDGKLLSNSAWGVGSSAEVEVGTFDPYTMEDTRNVVTITLGQKADGSQIYFESGTHSVQGANIGDWASVTDQANNRMNTQTLDFEIPEDNELPVASVEVQSPEQWLVTFNKDVNESAAQFAAKLKFQGYNTTSNTWVDNYTGATKTIASIGTAANLGNNSPDLVVTKIDDNKFLVEMDYDWSEVHDKEVKGKNYFNYNYRLQLPKDSVTNVANGKRNVEQNLDLNGAMDAVDAQSPIINADIKQVDGTGALSGIKVYEVTMSEPVKLNATANTEGITLAQGQTSLPVPTAEFVKKDGSKTIAGKIDTSFVDDYNKVLRAYAVDSAGNKTDLEAGEWTLIVRSISDDYGNTAASVTKDFTVEGSVVDTQFRVAWAYADQDSSDYAKDNGSVNDGNKDAVYVKFTKPVKITGDFASALATQNYTLNGKALPDGTQIFADIDGYDDHDAVVDSITILLPDGTITDTETTVLNITPFIESKAGDKLANPGEKKLSYEFETVASVSDTTELKAALADSSVRIINLDSNIVLSESLTIDRLVEINLGAHNITAGANDFKVNTTETGRMVINGTGIIDKLDVNAPNADFENNATITALTVTDLYSASLINNGTITTLSVNDDTSVVNAGTITAMTIESGSTVTIDNSGTITTLNNNGEAVIEAMGTITTIAGAGTITAGSDSVQDDVDLAVATQAVVAAETSKTQADVDAAQELVTALPAGAAKDALQGRIDAIVTVEDEAATALSSAQSALQTELDKVTFTKAGDTFAANDTVTIDSVSYKVSADPSAETTVGKYVTAAQATTLEAAKATATTAKTAVGATATTVNGAKTTFTGAVTTFTEAAVEKVQSAALTTGVTAAYDVDEIKVTVDQSTNDLAIDDVIKVYSDSSLTTQIGTATVNAVTGDLVINTSNGTDATVTVYVTVTRDGKTESVKLDVTYTKA